MQKITPTLGSINLKPRDCADRLRDGDPPASMYEGARAFNPEPASGTAPAPAPAIPPNLKAFRDSDGRVVITDGRRSSPVASPGALAIVRAAIVTEAPGIQLRRTLVMSWLETIQGALDAKEGDKAPDYFGPSIWDLPDAPVEFVTLRGLLAKGFVTMLCGKPSSGKSLFAALVALAVNGGFSVFGEDTFAHLIVVECKRHTVALADSLHCSCFARCFLVEELDCTLTMRACYTRSGIRERQATWV